MRLAVVVVAVAAICGPGPTAFADEGQVTDDVIREAVAKSIPLLEQAMKQSADKRKCFTCHNQAIPLLTVVEADRRGFTIDKENLTRQLKHTADHLARGKKQYLGGKGQGGRVITAGYALWALQAGQWDATETTAAVTSFLLQYQDASDHWQQRGKRPPTSGSDFMATYVALRGLSAFRTEEQKEQLEERAERVRAWLAEATPKDTEDRVFRLRLLHHFDPDAVSTAEAASELIAAQRDDGSWGQMPDMPGDAYATGTVLVSLLRAGALKAESEVTSKGLQYLLKTQLEDGSWHVVTRADGFQEYFEAGYPHDEDQFISVAAASWATRALLLALPTVKRE